MHSVDGEGLASVAREGLVSPCLLCVLDVSYAVLAEQSWRRGVGGALLFGA